MFSTASQLKTLLCITYIIILECHHFLGFVAVDDYHLMYVHIGQRDVMNPYVARYLVNILAIYYRYTLCYLSAEQ